VISSSRPCESDSQPAGLTDPDSTGQFSSPFWRASESRTPTCPFFEISTTFLFYRTLLFSFESQRNPRFFLTSADLRSFARTLFGCSRTPSPSNPWFDTKFSRRFLLRLWRKLSHADPSSHPLLMSYAGWRMPCFPPPIRKVPRCFFFPLFFCFFLDVPLPGNQVGDEFMFRDISFWPPVSKAFPPLSFPPHPFRVPFSLP